MADGFEDGVDGGRLVIATDEERMDCSGNGEEESNSVIVENNSSIQTTTVKIKMAGTQQSNLNHTTELPLKKSDNNVVQEHLPVDSSTAVESAMPDSTQKIEAPEDGELMKKEEEEIEQQHADIEETYVDKNSIEPTKGQEIYSEELQHGVHNFLNTSPTNNNGKNKKNVIGVDKSTCVFAKPNGMSSLDEHLLTIRPGTNLTIDLTIICKAGGNTLYFCAKWKGRDYHGVLTDGEPLYSHLCAQKRAHFSGRNTVGGSLAATGNGNNKDEIGNKMTGNGKQRGGKRGGGGTMTAKNGTTAIIDSGEKGKTATDPNSPNDPNQEDVANTKKVHMKESIQESQEKIATNGKKASTSNQGVHLHSQQHSSHYFPHHHQRRRRSSASSTSHSQHGHGLQETNNRTHPNRCPHRQCGFRFESIGDLNTHLLIGHGTLKEKAKIFTESAIQTVRVETESIGCGPIDTILPIYVKCKKMVTNDARRKRPETSEGGNGQHNVDEDINVIPNKKERKLSESGKDENAMEEDNSTGFSDISNEAAPTLEKEDEASHERTSKVGNLLHQTTAYKLESTMAIDEDETEKKPMTSHSFENIPSNANHHLTQSETISMLFHPEFPKQSSKCINNPETSGKKNEDIQSRKNSTINSTGASTLSAQFGGGPAPFPPIGSNSVISPAMADTAAAMFASGSSNPFINLSPQLQAFVASQQQQSTLRVGSAQPSAAGNAIGRFMSPPASGLLSLGTPLASVASLNSGNASQTTATMVNGPSTSNLASKSDSNHPHKIYELQQLVTNIAAANHQEQQKYNFGRASSTKSAMAVGGVSGTNISPTPKTMRPMSAMPSSAGGGGPASSQQKSFIDGMAASALPTTLTQQQFMLRPSSQSSSIVPASNGQFFPDSIIPGFSPLSATQMNLNPAAAVALFAQAAANAFPQISSGGQSTTTQQQQLRRPTTTNQNSQLTAAAQQMLPSPIGISNTAAGLQAQTNFLTTAANAGMDLSGMVQQIIDQSQPLQPQSHPSQQTQK